MTAFCREFFVCAGLRCHSFKSTLLYDLIMMNIIALKGANRDLFTISFLL